MLQKNITKASNNFSIEFKNVYKKFPKASNYAIKNANLQISDGEFVTILGSSGCGKTTLLKLVNRLYSVDDGEIFIKGENIKEFDPIELRRKMGYVIQQVGLFPYMKIKDNIGLMPKLLKWDASRIDARVRELMELVGLKYDDYASRFPSQLSGGQQQRIGVARALVFEPKIMLLDEPFGALDAITRLRLQDELKSIQSEISSTFLFVTHDINEAFKLGSRVIIMDEGEILQFDTPQNIIKNPSTEFVKSLIDSARAQEKLWDIY